MVRFLAKVILTLEPTLKRETFHDEIRGITAHHRGNLLQMIGVDPIIFRTNSSKGEVDLQIWVTTITGNALNRSILPIYFIGARKYLFVCFTKNSVNFVREMLDIAQDKINALYEFMILMPKGYDKRGYSRIKTKFRKLFAEKHLEKFSFHQWDSSNELAQLLSTIVEDIVVNIPTAIGSAPIGYSIDNIEKFVKDQGFKVNTNHEVVMEIDEIIFRVDLKRNFVFAEVSSCLNCPHECKVRKKLCIEIADKGFTTGDGFGDLRILSVLYAINDRSIMAIKGNKPQEDIKNQLKELRADYKRICKFKGVKIENSKTVEKTSKPSKKDN
ncbi:MAG: hypothetical protein ACTSSH_08155 [Candidatus Heimdallarchaeota archaeon]